MDDKSKFSLEDFYAGKIEPRQGDFIGSQIARSQCGFFTGKTRSLGYKNNPILAYEIRLASGRTAWVLANDLNMIAPGEFDTPEDG